MRILFVHPATEMSIGDVARGYRKALESQGHEIKDYHLSRRMSYHSRALPAEVANPTVMAHQASETILNEALYHGADLVLIISGLNVHPIAMWLLGKVKIPIAVVLTESPYDDESQAEWVDVGRKTGTQVDITVFTNDRYSAEKYGWTFLPPSYDSTIHHPVDSEPEFECDVMMVGTGWPERQRMLEGVNWDGINLKLYGLWPNIDADSPLHKFYHPAVVNNSNVPRMYCSAKININIHRASDVAFTPGPRVYELAACGAFQISDPREDLVGLFGDGVPTFNNASELETLIRFYMDRPEERRLLSAAALDAICDQDFDTRAKTLMATIEQHATATSDELVGQP